MFCFSELYVAFICRSGGAAALVLVRLDTQLHKTEALLSRPSDFRCSGTVHGSRGTVELTYTKERAVLRYTLAKFQGKSLWASGL